MESDMPLTDKGEKIKSAMAKEYGPEKGEKVLYASKNKGTISGIDAGEEAQRYFDGLVGKAHDAAKRVGELEADCAEDDDGAGVEGVADPEKGATMPVTRKLDDDGALLTTPKGNAIKL
jgi:hypothetical protein